MEKIKDKSNNELIEIQKKLFDEFESVKKDLLKLYDYWNLIEKNYNQVTNELNNRFGVNNK